MTNQHPRNTVRRWASPACLCVVCFSLLSSVVNAESAGLFARATEETSGQLVLFSEVASSREASPELEDQVQEPAHGELDVTGAESGLPKRNVRINLDHLAGVREDIDAQRAAPPVVLNLLEDVRFQAVFDDAAPTLWGYSLSGRLKGERFGTVTLVVNGNIVAGTVRTTTTTYSIRSVGVGIHVVEEVERPRLDEDDAIVPAASALTLPQPSVPPALEDDGSEIDVFVFYTPAARAALNGTRRARAQIELAFAETNVAYEAGGAEQRIRLIGAVETRYEETDRAYTDDPHEDLHRLQTVGDGHMDEVHLIRDAYAADLVHLVTEKGAGVGFVSPYNDTLGFARTGVVFDRVPGSTLAHELGHNMGLQHDRYSPYKQLNYPFPYSHGYVNQKAFEDRAPARTCFRTIMAYANQCADAGLSGPKLMRFSNPNQYYPDADGDPMGIPGDDPSEEVDGPADAVRSLNETRMSVANFRASANRCSYRLVRPDDARIVVGVDGGSFAVSVAVGGGCPVEAISHDEFVQLVTHRTDEGANVAVRVARNDGGTRIGLITIMGESVEILQRGRVPVADVCERSPWMRNVLTEHTGRKSCDEVTEFDLAEVYALSRVGDRMTGSIEPNDLDGLVNLRLLDLRGNRLSGPIPTDVGRLRKLRKLYLNGNELSGPIPPALGQLDLQHVELIGNALSGPIPPELGDLEGLTGSLYLDDNRLSGPIPEELANLRYAWGISLAGNMLTGDIPPALGSLGRARELRLRDNDLSGSVPPELGQLENLLWLSLRGNALTGCIPGGLRDVPTNDLDQLGLGYCAAVSLARGGPPDAPGEAGRVTEGTAASLTILAEPGQDTAFDVTVTVSGGGAFGVAPGDRTVTIPSGMTEATFTVDTENDDVEEPDGAFTATIMADPGFALTTSRSSASIVIDDDEGPSAPTIVSLIPEEGMLTVIWNAPPGDGAPISEYQIRYRPARPALGWQTWKRLSHETGGALQRDITGVNNRVEYDVQVRGVNEDGDGAWSETRSATPRACPDGIDFGDCRALRAVRDILVGSGTAMNWAPGLPIEEWTGVDVNPVTGRVVRLLLSGQGLGGTLPAELGDLTDLEVLWLHDNNLTGSMPPELGHLVNLQSLLLANNGLTGPIPAELGGLANLESLWLQRNELTGPLPATLVRLANLEELLLHNNRLTGPIASELGLLRKLRALRLSANQLVGSIPGSLRNLTNLRNLFLAGNQLTGCVPASLRDVEGNDLHLLDLPDCPPASVIDLLIESSPLDGRAYGTGERIESSVWFENDITVSGSPQLALMIGSGVRAATLIANRGSGGLSFRYVVGPADRDSDGISIAPDALALNGGRIRDVDGEDIVLDLGEHAITNNPFHQVRGALRELVPDQALEADGETLTLDLSRYFNVPEGRTITYGTPASSDPTVATAIIEDGLLKIMPLEGGVTTITVTATDHNGVTVTLSFRVTVTATMGGLRPWLMGILAEQEAGGTEEVEANNPQ